MDCTRYHNLLWVDKSECLPQMRHNSFIIFVYSSNTYLIWNKQFSGENTNTITADSFSYSTGLTSPTTKKHYQSDNLFHISLKKCGRDCQANIITLFFFHLIFLDCSHQCTLRFWFYFPGVSWTGDMTIVSSIICSIRVIAKFEWCYVVIEPLNTNLLRTVFSWINLRVESIRAWSTVGYRQGVKYWKANEIIYH